MKKEKKTKKTEVKENQDLPTRDSWRSRKNQPSKKKWNVKEKGKQNKEKLEWKKTELTYS